MGAEGMISFIAVAVILFPLAAAMVSDSNLGKMMNEETVNYSSLQKEIEPLPYVVSKADTGGGGINTTTIIIVVVSTATLTFLLATLIFCWYTRTYGGVQNDEKQILSLSRKEFLNGSSQKPAYNLQKSVKDSSKTSDQLLSTGSGVLRKDSSVNSSVSLGIPVDPPPGNLSAAGIPPLKPPPGRPELALKTPPGRKDLSVQCPPVNTNSPPNRSPVGAAPPVRAPSARRSPSARRPPSAAPAPPPPPPLSGTKPPPPPPPLKKGPAPPPPPVGSRPPPRPGLKLPRPSSEPGDPDGDDSNKAKLKPFFWDKVMANPDQAMVWHQIRAGSFQFNEEMIENLFGYNTTDKSKSNNKKSSSSQDPSSNFVQIMDPKKAQNLSIILKALNVTTNEVCDALKEGNELPVELIQTLLKVAPTGEEELKLRLYNGDVSRLGTAERFLKRLVEIPFAFKRLESLLFMCTLQEEQEIIKESFQTLEAACKELRKSRLFLKLLEAVLKTGNRMNDGTFRGSAQAFKLDTLLKLSDVKGVDGKTTLLHFVVLEIIRAEGIRAAKTAQPTETFSTFGSDKLVEESANNSQDSDEYYRNLGLQVVSSLSNELSHVTKAAILDADGLTGMVSKFGHALLKAREFLNTDLKNIKEEKHEGDDEHDDEEEDEFAVILANFVRDADKDVMWMLEEEKRIMALVKNTADYFHGQAGKDEGLRLFVIVRDFLIILDKVCKEIKSNPLKKPSKMTEKRDVQSSETKDVSEPKMTRTRTKDDTDDAQHETRENGDLERVKHDESSCKMQENDGLEHRKHEGEDGDSKQDELSCKMQKKDDLEHETHEDNDIQLKTTEDDDGSRPESQKKDDDSKHETHEDNDIQLKTAEDDDGSRPESRKKDDDSKHKRPEDNDIQLKTAEDDDGSRPESRKKDDEEMHKHQFRVPHERLLPAIALRRVDTFSSNSSSDED